MPHDTGSLWQSGRPPEVMRVTFPLIPAASTTAVSVQVSGFEDNDLLTHCDRLLCDSCSSGQCFSFSFLQIPPHDGHPCRSANRSPCRVDRGLSPPGHPAATMLTGTAPAGATRHTRRTTKKEKLPMAGFSCNGLSTLYRNLLFRCTARIFRQWHSICCNAFIFRHKQRCNR